MPPQIFLEFPVINHPGPQLALLNFFLTTFTTRPVSFSRIYLNLPIHRILINNINNAHPQKIQICIFIQLIIDHTSKKMSQQFRKLLQQFYMKINNTAFLDVYKRILIDQFDEAEVQPIHIIETTQKPSIKKIKKQQKRQEQLYKNTDFASVFLFAFMLDLLKRKQHQYLNIVQKQVNSNLDKFYTNKQDNQDFIRCQSVFQGFFQFCHFIFDRNYQVQHIEKLFKAFYMNTLQRRGLKKNQKQKYHTQAQTILSLMLANNNVFPSKKQISQPTSDTFQYNNLQFCINIQNLDEREEWTIGQGQNHINIAKQKLEYFVYEEVLVQDESSQQQLDSNWIDILTQSTEMKKEQSDRTRRLFDQLNIDECKSPTKSTRPPKSVQFRQGINKIKLGDFF